MTTETPHDARLHAVEILFVALVFAAAGATSLPDVNETHYLSQSKAYWNDAWCPGDLLLSEPPVHRAFHFLLGWGTLFLTLPQFAWTGRIATWLFQAWGFTSLIRAVTPARGAVPIITVCFLTLQFVTGFSGEWAFGGFEAKPLAYGCVFCALGQALRLHWGAAAVWAGAATAWHPLVGGWSIVALVGQWIVADRGLMALRPERPGFLVGALLAAIGIVPVLLMNRGELPDVVRQANEIYVFQRLDHHLDPATFPGPPIVRCGFVAVCTIGWRWKRRTEATAPLGFCLTAVLMAVTGGLIRWLLGTGDESAALLRFYWFRLPDVAVPLCCTLAIWSELQSMTQRIPGTCALALLILWNPCCPAVILLQNALRASPAERSLLDRERDDWHTVCREARELSPPDALFLTPRHSQTFKWHAERGEIATWKDIPQRAAGIVEWKRRLDEIAAVEAVLKAAPLDSPAHRAAAEQLVAVACKYRVSYIVQQRDRWPDGERRLALPVVYENNSFTLYQIPPRVEAEP